MARTAFIGLGAMGYPMAGHLARAGHQVAVFNRTPGKASAWARVYGGGACASVAEAANGADFVFACVGADRDVEEVFAAAAPAMARAPCSSITRRPPRSWRER